jgi:hypothetical protein
MNKQYINEYLNLQLNPGPARSPFVFPAELGYARDAGART